MRSWIWGRSILYYSLLRIYLSSYLAIKIFIFLFIFRILRFVVVVVEQICIFIFIAVLAIVVTRSFVTRLVVIPIWLTRPLPWLSVSPRTQYAFLVAALDLRCLHDTRLASRVWLISLWSSITRIVRVVIPFRLPFEDWIFTDDSIELGAATFKLRLEGSWWESA